MSFYNFVDEHLLLPFGDVMYGSSIHRRIKEFRAHDNLSYEELMDIQNLKIQRLVRHCYDSVPYYTKLFNKLGVIPEDIKSREDLRIIPILDKETIRANYNDFFSTAVNPDRIVKASTGGSTGTPLNYCKDTYEWSGQKAATLRAWEWYGIHLGDKIWSLGGNSIVKQKKRFSPKNIYDLVIMRNFKNSSADVSDDCMHKHYMSLMSIKPAVIRGYGSSIYIFARYIEKNHLPVLPLKAILTTGEVLLLEYRNKIEGVFGVPVYDEYGAGDGGILSHECTIRKGLHIEEELCALDITDINGNVLPDGTAGHVITTDLENFVFPFLRYKVGDMAYISEHKCQCGRQSRVLGEVIGRSGKLVYNKEGVPISPTMLPIMLYPNLDYHNHINQVLYNKIDKFQIRQDRDGDISILLKMKDKKDENNQFDYVISNYESHFVGSKVQLLFVDEIPTLPSGKEDYCVSEYDFQ